MPLSHTLAHALARVPNRVRDCATRHNRRTGNHADAHLQRLRAAQAEKRQEPSAHHRASERRSAGASERPQGKTVRVEHELHVSLSSADTDAGRFRTSSVLAPTLRRFDAPLQNGLALHPDVCTVHPRRRGARATTSPTGTPTSAARIVALRTIVTTGSHSPACHLATLRPPAATCCTESTHAREKCPKMHEPPDALHDLEGRTTRCHLDDNTRLHAHHARPPFCTQLSHLVSQCWTARPPPSSAE